MSFDFELSIASKPRLAAFTEAVRMATSKFGFGSDLDQLCVNTMRTLAIDAIQQASSGHPGTPMGMSPTVYMHVPHHQKSPSARC
jgi:hypothetical protein